MLRQLSPASARVVTAVRLLHAGGDSRAWRRGFVTMARQRSFFPKSNNIWAAPTTTATTNTAANENKGNIASNNERVGNNHHWMTMQRKWISSKAASLGNDDDKDDDDDTNNDKDDKDSSANAPVSTKKKRKPPKREYFSEKQKEYAGQVFDAIAPHVDMIHLQKWRSQLKKSSRQIAQVETPHHTTIQERLQYVLELSTLSHRKNETITKKKKRNTPPPPPPPLPPQWVQTLLTQWFSGALPTTFSAKQHYNESLLTNNTEYGPCANRSFSGSGGYSSNSASKDADGGDDSNAPTLAVDIIMRAREVAVQQPIFWNYSDRRKLRDAHVEAHQQEDPKEELCMKALKESVAARHHKKSRDTLSSEATAIATLLADRLPPAAFENMIEFLKKMDTTTTTSSKKKKGKQRMLVFSRGACNQCKLHSHLVVTELAQFLYYRPDYYKNEQDGRINDDSVSVDSDSDSEAIIEEDLSDTISQNIIDLPDSFTDPILQNSLRAWNKTRANFINTLLVLGNSDVFQLWRSTEEVRDAEQVSNLLERFNPINPILNRRSKGPSRKNVHLTLDAILLSDTTLDLEESILPPLPTVERTVFLDNLPIDTEETELLDLYSRCGTIHSVQIFNQRKDLDPGPLSKKQMKDDRRSHRRKLVKRKKWTRRRTPVYGMVTFATKEGYERAIDPTLSIFGKIIRRHPVRSVPASALTSIHVQDIPMGLYSLDMERKLSVLLHPTFYVCLDGGLNGDSYAEPNSCEIKFPNFELAYQSYLKLQELSTDGRDWRVNWMETPVDAMDYWTRGIGFDE